MSESSWNRLVSWAADNRKTIVLASAIAALATAGSFYVVSQQQMSPKKDSSSSSSSKNKKKKKAKKAKKEASSADEPAAKTELPEKSIAGISLTRSAPQYPDVKDWDKVKELSESERKELANSFKAAGNALYAKKEHTKAAELYSKALDCYIDPIFYSNRSACYFALEEYQKVVDDTTEAIKLRPDYFKCFRRRGTAHEKLENYFDAAVDITASCVLENFGDTSMNDMVDRLMRLNAAQVAQEEYKDRPKVLPSQQFIKTYLGSFRPRKMPKDLKKDTDHEAEQELVLALDQIEKGTYDSYTKALEHLDKAIAGTELQNLFPTLKALALEYRAIFNFLMNKMDEAKADIDLSLQLSATVQAYITRSSINLDSGDKAASQRDIELAMALNPEDPDCHHHQGQLYFLSEEFDKAIESYNKSLELDDSFVPSVIFKANSHLKKGERVGQSNPIETRHLVDACFEVFEEGAKKFPNSADLWNYYAEALLSTQKYSESLRYLDKAIALEKEQNPTSMSVLPLVSKALVIFQTQKDLDTSVDLCKQALVIDDRSEVAIGTLAQLYLSVGKHDEAMKMFKKNADYARSEEELVQNLVFLVASKIQTHLKTDLPVVYKKLREITPSQAY
ncbi:Mitochondrial import receptor subunit tom70 [Yarrowia sp. C11]|nr:Mitochondrial import receptor subunit tom70 [Yarrowia sp. E02]KAG5372949.1 Mitochondrial import receptor subunit tom70 [Yarrowia sp. C11]